LQEEELNKYLKAGEIACRVRKEAERITKPFMKVLELVNKLENLIKNLGAEPAFPINVSINDVAAHYTPTINDELTIPENAVVKIDIGVHIDGYIADTATTVSFDKRYTQLVEAAREALINALKIVKPGIKFHEIGRVIEETIKRHGYRPIYNLSGHSITRYTIHAGDVIPNYRDLKSIGRLKPGKAYAIEPFATNGTGFVKEAPLVTIYALKPNPKRVKTLSSEARKLYEVIYNSRRTLPFALRWYLNTVNVEKIVDMITELALQGLVVEYPVLIEKDRGIVTQFEHTLVVTSSSIYITTDSC